MFGNSGPYASAGLPPFTYRPPTSPYASNGSAADGAGGASGKGNGKGPTPFAIQSGDALAILGGAYGPGIVDVLSPHASMVAAAQIAASAMHPLVLMAGQQLQEQE